MYDCVDFFLLSEEYTGSLSVSFGMGSLFVIGEFTHHREGIHHGETILTFST